MTANSFGVSIPAVTCTVRKVCCAIREHLAATYLHMPKDVPSLECLIAGWQQHTGFPMVVGAVDGTHIPIMQPYINSQDYFAYKVFVTIKANLLMLIFVGLVARMMPKCFHTVPSTVFSKITLNHTYAEPYYLAETRLVCFYLETQHTPCCLMHERICHVQH